MKYNRIRFITPSSDDLRNRFVNNFWMIIEKMCRLLRFCWCCQLLHFDKRETPYFPSFTTFTLWQTQDNVAYWLQKITFDPPEPMVHERNLLFLLYLFLLLLRNFYLLLPHHLQPHSPNYLSISRFGLCPSKGRESEHGKWFPDSAWNRFKQREWSLYSVGRRSAAAVEQPHHS